jgi:hypothetical protein
VDRARVDEHDLPALVTDHVVVGEIGERQEECIVVPHPTVVAVIVERVDPSEVDAGQLGLLGELADRPGLERLALVDGSAHE